MKKILFLWALLLGLPLTGGIAGAEATKAVEVSCEQAAYEVQGGQEKVLACGEEITARDEESKEAYQAKGLVCYELGKFAEAHTNFTKAISLDANFAAAYLARSKNYRAIGAEMAAAADEAHWCALTAHEA